MNSIKFTLNLAFLLIASLSVSAQFSLESDTTTAMCMDYDHTSHIDVRIINNGADNTIKWTYTSFTAPSGWSLVSICDNNQCYYNPSLGFSKTSDVVGSGNYMNLQVGIQIDANANPGDGYAVINLVGGGSNLDAVVHGVVCPVSINELDENDIKLINTQNGIRIQKMTQNKASQYQIVDMQGRNIEQGKLLLSETAVNLDRSGIYIVQIMDEKGHCLSTQKFSIF